MPGAVAQALAEYFVATGERAITERGRFTVALSGGNTPRAAYELLAADPLRANLSWSNVFIYFGDERCVPPDDERSNYRMAREAFLDAVPIPSAHVARMRGEIDPGWRPTSTPRSPRRFRRGAAVRFSDARAG